MASLLLDKLEALKSNEIKLKEEQRFLEQQIALEMEKKRRIKMDATLTKLEVQVDELENIEGLLHKKNDNIEQRVLCYIQHNNENNIVPLFRTMIGIMEKQQREIDELRKIMYQRSQ